MSDKKSSGPAHLKIEGTARFERALVCGAPERAERIAATLQGSRALAKNREYHSYVGKHGKHEIIVVSHGVGSAGASICFEELFTLGVKSVIRVGTAGGLYDESQVGDVVIATAAVREDGVTPRLIPLEFPAVADLMLTRKLQRAAAKKLTNVRTGIVLTSDMFYEGLLGTTWDLYSKAKVVAVEMECAPLFVLGALRGVKCAALLSLDGNPLKWKDGNYEPHSDRLREVVEKTAQVALDALTAEDES